MDFLEEFHNYCNNNRYEFHREGDNIIVTHGYNVYFNENIKGIPENVIFRNTGCVYMDYMDSIPASTVFENTADVYISKKATDKLPKDYSGFKNKGDLRPENWDLKKTTVRYIISDEFVNFLNENSDEYPLCDKIRRLNGCLTSEGFPITFIDCCSNDEVSFLPVAKVYKDFVNKKKDGKVDSFNNYLCDFKKECFSEGLKNKVKTGRFIKKMFPNTPDSEVEEFVNLYKSFRNSGNYEIEIVYGEDIRTYYYKDNYDTIVDSVLHQSCYSWLTREDLHPNNNLNLYKQLEFFVNNPNVGLVILREKNAPINKMGKLKKDGTPDKRFKNEYREIRKIKGRALIWSCTNGKKYIDQLYTTKNAENYIYRRYAIENSYLCYDAGDSYAGLEIQVPESIRNLEVIPGYLDTLNYDENKNIVKGY